MVSKQLERKICVCAFARHDGLHNDTDRALRLAGYPPQDLQIILCSEEFPRAYPPSDTAALLIALGGNAGEPAQISEDDWKRIAELLARSQSLPLPPKVLVLSRCVLSLEDHCRFLSLGINAFLDVSDNISIPELSEQLHKKLTDLFTTNTISSESSQFVRDYEIDVDPEDSGIIGQSESLRRLVVQTHRAGRVSGVPVLISGESGTGKQRLAEYLHRCDPQRRDKPFVTVNCAAITGSLAESELFGHKSGAFTGATRDRQGYFRSAHGGTILLDEISELEQSLQPKILRLLQESLVRPVGDDREYRVDVRVIAATNRNLEKMIQEGQFRLDLFQRLQVIQLCVPPLRERIDDIPLLFQAFLEKYADYYPMPITEVDPRVYEAMGRLVGDGNIRELENIVRRILVFKEQGERIELTDIPSELLSGSWSQGWQEPHLEVSSETLEALAAGRRRLQQVMDEFERTLLTRLVKQDENRSRLAQNLGITRRTLYNKLNKYNLPHR